MQLGRAAARHNADARVQAPSTVSAEAAPEVDAQAQREQLAQVLDALEASGLLSEPRAAQSLVQSKAARYGVRRLHQMLRDRAIDADVADPALQEVRATEFERAFAVWQRRFGTLAVDVRERARQHRFLAGRGFAGDVIDRILKGEHPPEAEG